MTDVIGTAKLDEQERRAPRVPRWIVWAAVMAVAVGVVVVPYERTRLADSAARWLQQQWAMRDAYDDARASVIEAVNGQAGALDERAVAAATVIADREEAAALRRMAQEMSHRRTWSPDVAHARDAAVGTIRLEIAALTRDATDETPTIGYLFAPDVDRSLGATSGLIAAMARHHDLAKPRVRPLMLRPATAILARLHHVTDFPTGLSIVVSGARGTQVLHLDDGSSSPLRVPQGQSELHSWAGRIVVVSRHGMRAFDTDGRPGARFTTAFGEVLSGSGPNLWLNGTRGVREFSGEGRPVTPWIARPAGRAAVAATRDVVVLIHVQDEVNLVAELWHPLTGTLRVLPTSCYGGWAAAERRIVSLPCGGERQITTVDALTGAVRQISIPGRVADSAPETSSTLSPTGGQLAVDLAGSGPRPGLVDLRTGRFRRAPGDGTLQPTAWSADGQWVLLADEGSFNNGRAPQLALWRPRDGRTTSIRLPVGESVATEVQLLAPRGH